MVGMVEYKDKDRGNKMSNNDEKRKPIRIAQMMTEMNYGG